jgi:hypothetical protein
MNMIRDKPSLNEIDRTNEECTSSVTNIASPCLQQIHPSPPSHKLQLKKRKAIKPPSIESDSQTASESMPSTTLKKKGNEYLILNSKVFFEVYFHRFLIVYHYLLATSSS